MPLSNSSALRYEYELHSARQKGIPPASLKIYDNRAIRKFIDASSLVMVEYLNSLCSVCLPNI